MRYTPIIQDKHFSEEFCLHSMKRCLQLVERGALKAVPGDYLWYEGFCFQMTHNEPVVLEYCGYLLH